MIENADFNISISYDQFQFSTNELQKYELRRFIPKQGEFICLTFKCLDDSNSNILSTNSYSDLIENIKWANLYQFNFVEEEDASVTIEDNGAMVYNYTEWLSTLFISIKKKIKVLFIKEIEQGEYKFYEVIKFI